MKPNTETVRRSSQQRGKSHEYTRSAPNEYPDGCVPRETGWYSREGAVSKLPGHNRITVCRPKR